jgi:hypothetical protein
MAKTQDIEVKIKAVLDAGPTISGLRELKKLQREVGSDTKAFKMAEQGMLDFGDSIKTAKGQSQDLTDTLASAPGPIGLLARGYDQLSSSTNKWGLAIKASGVGLLVALVGQLVTAFTSNEKAMKKLEPVMIMFEQILGGIFKALEPVFDLFVDLVMWVMPKLQMAIGGLYTAFAALGSFLKNFIVVQVKNFMAFGKILKGVFTLDLDTIKEGFNDVKNNIKEGVKNVVDTTTKTWENYNSGLKDITKTQKKNLGEQTKNTENSVNKQKELIDGLLKEREADLAKQKAIALDAADTERKRFEIEKKFAEDTYNAKKKALEDTRALYPKGSKEYKDYTTQLTNLEAEYITKKTEFRNKDKELERKEFDETLKAFQESNKKKIDDLTATFNKQKGIYGENSKEARDAQDAIFKAQAEGYANELKLYEGRKDLTKEELARIEELKTSQTNLTTTIQNENTKRLQSDIEAAGKKLDAKKKESDDKFALDMKDAGNDFKLQKQILTDKFKADEEYFAAQEILYKGNQEKLDEIDRARLANQQTYLQQQEEIRRKQVDTQLQATDTIISAFGAETAAGKAALIAKQVILAKELILEVKRTIAFSKAALAQSKIAVATGAAQTAKIGFPQNVPLLILYAAQAATIIKTVIDATKAAKEPTDIDTSNVGSVPAGTAVPKPRGMATGGLVQGIGGPKSDLIPAMLSNGESVINAQSTSMFRPLLSSINEIGGGKRFAEGGLAISSFGQDQTLSQLTSMMNMQQAPIKTYVVASEMSNQQMMDRNIKTRSTL